MGGGGVRYICKMLQNKSVVIGKTVRYTVIVTQEK